MAEQLSENVFQQVNDSADIVTVVSYYLGNQNLIRKGKIFVAICPFHSDSHPSMRIDPGRNTFKCFACGAGGAPIRFVKDYTHVDGYTALKKVCEICSLPVPNEVASSTYVDKKAQEYEKELSAMVELSKFYQLSLNTKEGESAKEYLKNRGIDNETVLHFSIGYSPLDSKASIETLRKLGYEVSTLERAGILSNSSRLEDRNYGRLMFPLSDTRGHIVGFSGRKISEDQEGGKYVNSTESLIFRKGEMLYHFREAKEEARKCGYIYVVEGFMDVIALYRAGIRAAVGSMGTAITDDQVRALKSLGVDIRLCLDADEPGQMGMESALPVFLRNDCKVRIVRKFRLGKDSDEVLTNHGKDELIEAVNRMYDPFLFLLARQLNGRKELSDTLEINTFITKARAVYASLEEVEQNKDLETLAKITSLDKGTLSRLLKNQSQTITQNEKKEDKNDSRESGKSKPRSPYAYQGRNEGKYFPTSNPMMDKNYNRIDFFQELIGKVKDSAEGKSLLPELLENESQIMMVLTKSRQAYSAYQEARIDFVYSPFYILACAIGNIYLSNRTTDAFTANDYEILSNSLKHRVEIDEDDPLGINEVEDEIAGKESYENETLNEIISYMSQIDNSFYEADKFNQALILHPSYVRYHQYLAKVRTKGYQKTIDDITEGAKLVAEIKRHHGKIRKTS